jgi:DNA polymerase-3 subunit delta
MQLYANQLEASLRRDLAPLYLIHGDEPLLVEECRDAVRRAARAQGFAERELLTVESGFDWSALFASSHSLALFAEKRFIDLRLPTGKPGDNGGKVLAEIAATPPADTLIVVSCGKLEKSALGTKWVKAFERAGAVVAVYPVEAAQLPAWIARRMQAHGLRADAGVVELLAHHFEGNLLACAQEIDRLALGHAGQELRVEDIEQDIADQARFTVFGLADACLEGRREAVPRMLRGLRAEGEAPALVLWALVREARLLATLGAELDAGRPLAQVIESPQVWTRRKPLVSQALKRSRQGQRQGWLLRAARADRVIKGRRPGDEWRELECLALDMAGLVLPTCR